MNATIHPDRLVDTYIFSEIVEVFYNATRIIKKYLYSNDLLK